MVWESIGAGRKTYWLHLLLQAFTDGLKQQKILLTEGFHTTADCQTLTEQVNVRQLGRLSEEQSCSHSQDRVIVLTSNVLASPMHIAVACPHYVS